MQLQPPAFCEHAVRMLCLAELAGAVCQPDIGYEQAGKALRVAPHMETGHKALLQVGIAMMQISNQLHVPLLSYVPVSVPQHIGIAIVACPCFSRLKRLLDPGQ